MTRYLAIAMMVLITSTIFAGDTPCQARRIEIAWKRLVDTQGQTCPRCHDTGSSVEIAARKIKAAFEHLGIVVIVKTTKITQKDFEEAPLESNTVTINGKTIEQWVGGKTGQSPCCASCGDNDCRTVVAGGKEYEAIPVDLIVKAAMIAGAKLF